MASLPVAESAPGDAALARWGGVQEVMGCGCGFHKVNEDFVVAPVLDCDCFSKCPENTWPVTSHLSLADPQESSREAATQVVVNCLPLRAPQATIGGSVAIIGFLSLLGGLVAQEPTVPGAMQLGGAGT